MLSFCLLFFFLFPHFIAVITCHLKASCSKFTLLWLLLFWMWKKLNQRMAHPYLSINPSTHLFINPFIHHSIHPFIHPSITIHSSVHLSLLNKFVISTTDWLLSQTNISNAEIFTLLWWWWFWDMIWIRKWIWS